MESTSFTEFPKLARLSRECIVTEKIDGTNCQVFIWDETHEAEPIDDKRGAVSTVGEPPSNIPFILSDEGVHLALGSRTKWITPTDDNHGFAKWALDYIEELMSLGHGRHFGEWWGSGIQRGYGLAKGEKHLSLFNVTRWCLADAEPKIISAPDAKTQKWQDILPVCVGLVPVLYRGPFSTSEVDKALQTLALTGSQAVPGFMKPEGVVCWHTAANMGFKKTIDKDDMPKSLVKP